MVRVRSIDGSSLLVISVPERALLSDAVEHPSRQTQRADALLLADQAAGRTHLMSDTSGSAPAPPFLRRQASGC